MTPIYSVADFSEPFSLLSHLIAAEGFIVAGGLRFYRERTSRSRFISLFIFIFSCLMRLTISGIFRLLKPGGIGEVFQ